MEHSTDAVSKRFIHNIIKLRKLQAQKLPLFLQAIRIVKRQLHCLETVRVQYVESELPVQISRVLILGVQGLKNYTNLIQGIRKVLKKNTEFVIKI